jgi:hypothetical protein
MLDVSTAAYEIGHCGFLLLGHHGTPNQRLAAAEWGESLASSAHKQGKLIPARTLVDLFDEALPDIVAPDAP